MRVKRLMVAAAIAAATIAVSFLAGAPARADAPLTPIAVGQQNFIAVSPDGSTVAIVAIQGSVNFYDVATGALRTYDLGLAPGSAMLGQPVFSPDGQTLYVPNAAGSGSFSAGYIYQVNVSNGTSSSWVMFGENHPWSLAISADGSRLAVMLRGGTMMMLDMVGSPPAGFGAPFTVSSGNIFQVCASPDHSLVYVPDALGNDIDVVDMALGQVVDHYTATDMSLPYSCTVANDGTLFVGEYTARVVYRFDTQGNGTPSAALPGGGFGVGGISLACGNLYVGARLLSQTVNVLDPSSLAETGSLTISGSTWSTFGGPTAESSTYGWLGGSNNAEGLVQITPTTCSSPTPDPGPNLPDTGVDANALGAVTAVGAGLLVAGVLAIFLIRRRANIG